MEEKKVMYRLCKWSYNRIETFEITKVGDKSVWFINKLQQPYVQLLETSDHKWFENKKYAIQEAHNKLNLIVEAKIRQLNDAKIILQNFETKYL